MKIYKTTLLFIFLGLLGYQSKAQVSPEERQALIDFYNATDGDNWTNNTNWLTDAPVSEWYGVTVSDSKVSSIALGNNNLSGRIPISIGGLNNLKELYLNNNLIIEDIPAELGQLNNLQVLYLQENQLSGAIPEELGQITSLLQMYLHNNELTGAIPASIGSLVNLRDLVLSYNQLSGSLPAELGELTNLQGLYLQENQLSGKIPNELGQMTGLLQLDMHNNELNGEIPVSLGNLQNLKALVLSFNELSGEIPEELGQLTSLLGLYLHSNKFLGSIPQSIKEIRTLDDFQFQDNKFIFSNFETEVVALKNKLKTFVYSPQARVDEEETLSIAQGEEITLTSTVLTSLNNSYQWYKDGVAIAEATDKDLVISNATDADAGVYHLTATNSVVTDLTIERNSITLTVTPPICGVSDSEKQALLDLYNATNGPNWTTNTNWLTDAPVCDWFGITVENGNVVEIGMQNNGLEGEIPSSLGNLTNLTGLNFLVNRLSGPIPPEIGNLINLTSLGLERNLLSGDIPASIANLTQLTRLNISSNQLSGSIPIELGTMSNLTGLSLFRNSLTGSIPSELGNLTNLTGLNLGENQFTGSIPSEIGNLTSLTTLNLSINRLSGIIPSELGNLIDLTILGLSRNEFTGSIPTSIVNLSKLTNLNISSNKLSGIIPPELGSMVNLAGLNLYRNRIEGFIPPELGNLTNLTSLSLGENLLEGSIPSEIGSLTKLTSLNLFQNKLEGSIPVALGNLINLTSLNLGRNKLTGSILDYPNLTSLNVASNRFVFSNLEPYIAKEAVSFSYIPQDALVDLEETISVTENESITLTSSILASPKNTYQWYKDGVAIIGATNKELVINNISTTDAGVYYFIAANSIITDFTLQRNPITIAIDEATNPQFLTDCDTCKSFKPTPGEYTVSGWVREMHPQQKISYTNTAIEITLTDENNENSKMSFLPSGAIIDGWQQIKGNFLIPERTIYFKLELVNANIGGETTPINNEEYFENPEDGVGNTKLYSFKQVDDLTTCNGGVIDPNNFDLKLYVSATIPLELGGIYRIASEVDSYYVQVVDANPSGDVVGGSSEPRMLSKVASYDCNDLISQISNDTTVIGVMAYFDDIRVHPFNSNMKSFVYDPQTQRLMAELDENNYATFYEYDQEGGLIRVKKETEKGVFAIQETRSSSPKK